MAGCSGQGLDDRVDEAVEKGRSQQHMLKVTGLGQLARLIELGCNVGVRSPGPASQHCPQASDNVVPGHGRRGDECHKHDGSAIAKAIAIIKPDRVGPADSDKPGPTGGRLKLAVRKATPMARPSRRASIKRALASGAPDRRASTLAKLEADEVAPSGRGPRASRWRTWVKLHRNLLPDKLV